MSIEKTSTLTLEAPTIEEAPSGELDWHALNGKNFNVIIQRLPQDSAAKKLELKWQGTTADGEELSPERQEHLVEWTDIFNGLKIELKNDLAKAVVGGSAVIDYEIEPDLKSPPLNITVVDGKLEPELKAPEIIEARGSGLSPDSVGKDGATVRVETVAPILEGDQISLTVVATNDKGTVIELEPMIDEAKPQHTEFIIVKGLIDAIAGGSLTLCYTVKGKTSPTLELRVDYGIIPPELEGELGLPPGDLIKIIVPKYTGMAGDEIAMSVELQHLIYRSPQKTPNKIEDLAFDIPSGIFTSALSTSATACYHVTHKVDVGEYKTWNSLPLNTILLGHGTDIRPPRYMSFADEAPRYILYYPEISAGSKVDVYWHAEGSPTRKKELAIKYDGTYYYVSIPKDWITADKRKTVCGNYAIIQNDGASGTFSPGAIFTP